VVLLGVEDEFGFRAFEKMNFKIEEGLFKLLFVVEMDEVELD